MGPLDEATIRDFLHNDYRRLVAGLSLLARSREAAEEAVQEALARAWERSERGEHIESLMAWVTVVSTNLLRSAFRRLRAESKAGGRMNASTGAGASGSWPMAASDDRVDVARAIRSLPQRQREAVVLHYFADLSLEQIAAAIGGTPGAIKGVLHRARRSLAEALAEQRPEEVNDAPGGR